MGLIRDLYNSFQNKPEGFSARKLSAFTGVTVAVIVTMRFCNDRLLVDVITVWLLFALLCLGIITLQQVIDFRGGKSTTTIEKSEKVEVTEKSE